PMSDIERRVAAIRSGILARGEPLPDPIERQQARAEASIHPLDLTVALDTEGCAARAFGDTSAIKVRQVGQPGVTMNDHVSVLDVAEQHAGAMGGLHLLDGFVDEIRWERLDDAPSLLEVGFLDGPIRRAWAESRSQDRPGQPSAVRLQTSL